MGADVTIFGSQKGLMLPPGIGFNALSPRAIEASKNNKIHKSYWAWDEILESNKTGYWPTTPSTNLMYGLHEAMDMMMAALSGVEMSLGSMGFKPKASGVVAAQEFLK